MNRESSLAGLPILRDPTMNKPAAYAEGEAARAALQSRVRGATQPPMSPVSSTTAQGQSGIEGQ